MVAVHIVVYIDNLPVPEIDPISVDILAIGVIYERHLWWCFHLTLEDSDVVACVIIPICVGAVFSAEEPDVFEADSDSQKHPHC